MDPNPVVAPLKALLAGDLVENWDKIEAAAQDAVKTISNIGGQLNLIALNARLTDISGGKPFTIDDIAWMMDSDAAS